MMGYKKLILIGASGHGKVCAEIAELSGKYDEIFFLDDNRELKECVGYKVVGIAKDYLHYKNDNTEFFVSIGNNKIRKRIQGEIEGSKGKIATLIHKKATISKDVSIDAGTVVMAGTVINPGANIGKGVIVNTSSSVDHDCKIGNYTHIAVGVHLCGTVTVKDECWIGAGAVVSNNLKICNGCVIGAGTVVVKNIEEVGKYIGIPARKMK